MKFGAQDTPHISVPHSQPVCWVCSRKSSSMMTVMVKATYWLDARIDGARRLGCEPDQVLCVEVSASEAAAPASLGKATHETGCVTPDVGAGAVASGVEPNRKHLNGKARR